MNDVLAIEVVWNTSNCDAVICIPLRPLFAGLAMHGLLAGDIERVLDYDQSADLAVGHADAALKRMEEKPEEGGMTGFPVWLEPLTSTLRAADCIAYYGGRTIVIDDPWPDDEPDVYGPEDGEPLDADWEEHP